MQDAGIVCLGGEQAVRRAHRAGKLAFRKARGVDVIRALDLRNCGLLMEPSGSHGLDQSTATNIIKLLAFSIDRGELLELVSGAVTRRCVQSNSGHGTSGRA